MEKLQLMNFFFNVSVYVIFLSLTIIRNGVVNGREENGAFSTRFRNDHISLEAYQKKNFVKTNVRCATTCLRARDRLTEPFCAAYTFDQREFACRLFQTNTTERFPQRTDMYMFQVPAEFTSVTVNGRQYNIFLSIVRHKFVGARAYCYSIGGHLLHFDSIDVYTAADLATKGRTSGKYHYVGMNDIEEEGTWVHDLDNTPIDDSLLDWVVDGEENMNKDHENGNPAHCGTLRLSGTPKLCDRDCNYTLYFLCERNRGQ